MCAIPSMSTNGNNGITCCCAFHEWIRIDFGVEKSKFLRILLFIVTEKEEVTMKSFRVYNEERLAENVTHLIYIITNKEIYF